MNPKLNNVLLNGLWISIYVLRLHAVQVNVKKHFTNSGTVSKILGVEDTLINTEGCSIPNYIKTITYTEHPFENYNCGTRLVFLIKTSNDEVSVLMDFAVFPANARAYTCFYQFVSRSTAPGQEDISLKYSEWHIFEHGDKIPLEEEIIKVQCELLHYELADRDNFTTSTYKDAYMILKKKSAPQRSENAYNVLLIGIDTISRGRAYNTFPKIASYFKKQEWLDYRGYHKIGRNSYPNMMAFLGGIHPDTLNLHTSNIEFFRNKLIWNHFKQQGYMTAYGEDTTNVALKGFKKPPTDHYARPFSLLGHNKSGTLICQSKKSSNLVILNYAKQFIKAYSYTRFFGLFWFSTFTHEPSAVPSASEKMLLDFLKELRNSGVVNNTFIVFFSDHGINFGPNAISKESYYDSRLPMLFMWVPVKFRQTYKNEYFNLKINQIRLTTPLDLHATLLQVLKFSGPKDEFELPDACTSSKGLFSEVPKNRTCVEAKISVVYCTCHGMIEMKKAGNDYKLILATAINHINEKAALINTKDCYNCHELELKSVLKNYFYKYGNETIFVIISDFSPINITYEILVSKSGETFTAINSRALTSIGYRESSCTLTGDSREYCLCQYNGCNNRIPD